MAKLEKKKKEPPNPTGNSPAPATSPAVPAAASSATSTPALSDGSLPIRSVRVIVEQLDREKLVDLLREGLGVAEASLARAETGACSAPANLFAEMISVWAGCIRNSRSVLSSPPNATDAAVVEVEAILLKRVRGLAAGISTLVTDPKFLGPTPDRTCTQLALELGMIGEASIARFLAVNPSRDTCSLRPEQAEAFIYFVRECHQFLDLAMSDGDPVGEFVGALCAAIREINASPAEADAPRGNVP